MPTKFCTVDDVKARLQAGGDDYLADDLSLTDHIQQATTLVRSYTRRNWEQKSRIEHFSTPDISVLVGVGDGVASFYFKERPLISVTSIVYSPDGDWTDSQQLDPSYYEVDTERSAFFIYPGVLRSRTRALRATYVAGFPTDDTDAELLVVSPDLRQATALQAAYMWKRMVNQTVNVKQKQDKIGLTNYHTNSAGLTMEALALLKTQTRILVGGNG